MQVPALERMNFFKMIGRLLQAVVFWRNDNFKAIDIFDDAIFFSDRQRRRSRAQRVLPSPVPTIGASGFKRGTALALHVRTHQSAVRVIMLKEWNQACHNGNQLLWRHVHVGDFAAIRFPTARLYSGPSKVGSANILYSSSGAEACAMTHRSSWSAVMYSISSVTTPSRTIR